MEEDLYRLANVVFVVLHLGLSGLFAWLAVRRPADCLLIRRLCYLLAAFFISGAGTHFTNLFDAGPEPPAQAWGFAARAVFVVALVPLLVRTARGVRTLPTPGQYQAMIRERDEALARKDLEARTRVLFQRQLEERNGKLRALADEQREQIERLHARISDSEYMEMRRRLHAIRNA